MTDLNIRYVYVDTNFQELEIIFRRAFFFSCASQNTRSVGQIVTYSDSKYNYDNVTKTTIATFYYYYY